MCPPLGASSVSPESDSARWPLHHCPLLAEGTAGVGRCKNHFAHFTSSFWWLMASGADISADAPVRTVLLLSSADAGDAGGRLLFFLVYFRSAAPGNWA